MRLPFLINKSSTKGQLYAIAMATLDYRRIIIMFANPMVLSEPKIPAIMDYHHFSTFQCLFDMITFFHFNCENYIQVSDTFRPKADLIHDCEVERWLLSQCQFRGRWRHLVAQVVETQLTWRICGDLMSPPEVSKWTKRKKTHISRSIEITSHLPTGFKQFWILCHITCLEAHDILLGRKLSYSLSCLTNLNRLGPITPN